MIIFISLIFAGADSVSTSVQREGEVLRCVLLTQAQRAEQHPSTSHGPTSQGRSWAPKVPPLALPPPFLLPFSPPPGAESLVALILKPIAHLISLSSLYGSLLQVHVILGYNSSYFRPIPLSNKKSCNPWIELG